MSDRVTRRHPELGCSVIQLAVQRSPIKTPDAITDEAMRLMDEREARAKRQWAPILTGDAVAVAIIFVCLVVLWAIGG